MTRSYLKYVPRGCAGVITSNDGNVVVVRTGEGKLVICTPGLENMNIFDLDTLEIAGIIPGGSEEGPVCSLSTSVSGSHLGIGYGDGHVSIYSTEDWSPLMARGLGHKLNCKVLCTAICDDTTLAASGGSDTDIVVWDVPAQDPIFRLRGHKSAILGLRFMQNNRRLVSASGDGLIKVWDPELRGCIHSFVGSATQVTCMVMDNTESRLIVGSRDNQLKVYNSQVNEEDKDEFVPYGSLERQNHRPAAMMSFNPSHTILAVQAADRVIEFWQVLSEKGVQSKISRQKKRRREKGAEEEEVERTGSLEFSRLDATTLRTSSKIRSFCFVPHTPDELLTEPDRLIVALNDNSFEEWLLTTTDDKANPVTVSKARVCDTIGHRGEIRASAMSSSNRTIATCATGGVKVWRIELEEEGEEGSIADCTHTIPIPEPTCLTYLPGDQHIVAGTKDGTLELISLAQSRVLETFEAHKGEVTCVTLRGDKRGVASAGKDHMLKIWSLDLVQQDGGRVVTLVESSILEFTDGITAVTYSEDNKFLAVALQDNTIKIYYADTSKFFLSLYGHKYPVTAVSISSDSTLLASASIDKNVKLWGLDFGDCHRSLFAHDDYVTDVKFIGGTHYFWTAGKDGVVKAWDGDKFNHIQTLRGHHGAVWSLELSKEGGVLISCGMDRSLRSFVRTEQQIFPEEEREQELQEAADKENAASAAYAALDKADAEVGVAGQRSAEHIRLSEKLVDTLDIVQTEIDRLADPAAAKVQHPMMGKLSPYEYLGMAVEGIKGHEMRYTLSGLPAEHSKMLLKFSVDLLKHRTARPEAVAKVCLFLCRQHSAEIGANPDLRNIAISLHTLLARDLGKELDTHGMNISGLGFLQQMLQEQQDRKEIFFDLSLRKGHKKQKRMK